MERIRDKVKELNSKSLTTDPVDTAELRRSGLKEIQLRPYQEAGVNWLLQRYDRRHGCILGDEMGLGKTCQTISLLVCLAGREDRHGPHLILSPLSVLDNWKTELARFAPHLKTVFYVGDKDSRATLRSKIQNDFRNMNVLLTTYEICLKDESFLNKTSWDVLIVDEAHRLKNRNSQLHQSLLDFDVGHRVLLTGTPIQNNLAELYALLCFVAPKIFRYKYCDEFVETYSENEEETDMSGLHDLMKPFLLRRVKSQVVRDLPKRSEVVLFHGMSALQKKFYKAILTKDLEVFESGRYSVPRTRMMNILMQLRKCVNHPYLFDGVEPEPFDIGEHLVEASGKLVLVDQLLAYLADRKHKVLLFSQMTHALDIVQDYLGYRGYTYERLDGSVRGEERYLAIQNFNKDSSTFVFLLSTRAGGQGLNLVAADTVIFLDSDFNPQNDLQAAARAHRIGQTRPVKIIRLIGRSTVEEIILRRAEAKLKLTESVIEGDQFALGVSTSSGKDSAATETEIQLQDILKFGVDKLLENDDSSIETVDFDAILGPSSGGEWLEVEDKNTMVSLAAQTMEVEDGSTEENVDSNENIYRYEGTDYSQQPSTADKEAVDNLIQTYRKSLETAEGDGRALRKTKTSVLVGVLPETRKPRRKLTPEELEQRRQKRVENAARRAEEAQEEEDRRQAEKLRRRAAKWEAHGYCSYNVSLDEDEESDEEDVVMETDEESDSRAIHYIVGDVTKPRKSSDKAAIIVHCVDDSGGWGSGGLFSAISSRSIIPEEKYSLAGDMKDLTLGDAHVIPIDASEDLSEGNLYCALIVAQHRDRHNNLSGIKLSALSEGLQRIYKAAKEKKASVHLPRIGHATPGFNWYGTERLIRKHLAAKGIPTYIYYYQRRQMRGKRASSSSPQPSTSKVGRFSPVDPVDPSDEHLDETSDGGRGRHERRPGPHTVGGGGYGGLPDFMEDVAVWFLGVPQTVKANLTRYLIAYNGDVYNDIDDSVTHVVVMATERTEEDDQEIQNVAESYSFIPIVTTSWLDECFRKQRKVAHQRHLLETP